MNREQAKALLPIIKEFKDEILRIKDVEVTMGYYGRLALSNNKENHLKPWKSNDEPSLTERIKDVERYFRTGKF